MVRSVPSLSRFVQLLFSGTVTLRRKYSHIQDNHQAVSFQLVCLFVCHWTPGLIIEDRKVVCMSVSQSIVNLAVWVMSQKHPVWDDQTRKSASSGFDLILKPPPPKSGVRFGPTSSGCWTKYDQV